MLLTISEDAFARLHSDLQGDAPFFTVESMANQTVVVRTKAVSDVYFSSEAYDDYGPEPVAMKITLTCEYPIHVIGRSLRRLRAMVVWKSSIRPMSNVFPTW